jgi:nicotinate-nucleotide adenylyltransferase
MSQPRTQAHAPVGVLGGTFDPIHYGHLRPALELLEALGLAELRLIPGRVPPHRPPPRAPAESRLDLVRLAAETIPGVVVDDRELHRDGPSYSVDTLRSLRGELGPRPICFAMGSDAFLGLQSWYRWRELAQYAHLVVMERPGHEVKLEGALGEWTLPRRTRDVATLRREAAGRVFFLPVSQLDISATGIRRLIAQGRSARCLMPERVWESVAGGGLYGYPQI